MNVFDIIGPIMIGPSSSHTAGAVRIGLMSRLLLGTPAVKAYIRLHGSFAQTYKGHGTDRALAAGIMGMQTDDERIRRSLQIAKEIGLAITFEPTVIPDAHPNTAEITLTDANGKTVCIQGASVGGGNIVITKIDGREVKITGQSPTIIVVHNDIPGMIAAVTALMAQYKLNVYNFNLARDKKGGTAIMTLQIDGRSLGEDLQAAIEKIPGVTKVIFVRPF
ncbi:L-serine ammonia-lyase, iron-sulfur-dependent, subunit beta [Treponema medium]|uniref:L-serine ammonia-lyase, iron-sulfur-dependent subunit beta n=1 Tax=Treponema medium TaxID=58231 RepID=UPI00198097FE|nr:L-serine ammonia-lyase, iron-sulfur-dependent subunit beta [Treponema medium]QSH93058.1 L-serine ammonia-lyase, iron-sulfur-dependent, subunit beta [Treponema medium]